MLCILQGTAGIGWPRVRPLLPDLATAAILAEEGGDVVALSELVVLVLLDKVARWQNLIPSFPWIAPRWRAWGAVQGKEGIEFCSIAIIQKFEGPNTHNLNIWL